MEHLHSNPRRQIIIGNQLVDIRAISLEQVFRRLHVFGEIIEHLYLFILVDPHDTGTSPAIIDRGQVLQIMQSAVGILYLYAAQVIDGFVFLFRLCLFFFVLFVAGDIVTDDNIVGILPDLERGARRILRIKRRQPGGNIGTGNLV